MLGRYFLVRFLTIVPALFGLCLIVFILKAIVPDEIAENRLNAARIQNPSISDKEFVETIKRIRADLKMDLPVFYFTIESIVLPDSLHKIYPLQKAEFLKNLLLTHGSGSTVTDYYSVINGSLVSPDRELQRIAQQLFGKVAIDELLKVSNDNGLAENHPVDLAIKSLIAGSKPYEALLPHLKWNGFENQFHHWFGSLLLLDMGKSNVDSQPVATKIVSALKNTLLITLPALIILVMVSIPLGMWLSRSNGFLTSGTRTLLFSLDAIPLFWLALLLIFFLSSGSFLNILPAYGMRAFQDNSNYSLWDKTTYLILPTLSLFLTGLGYMTLQVMKAFNDERVKLYVLAARSKGLSEPSVYWGHIFRNALIPIITIFIGYLTAAFAGSLVVEVVFSIPGMGKLLFDSVITRDFNVILGVILLIGFITMITNVLADISYRIVNPAISFEI